MTYRLLNRYFTFVYFFAPPVLGSVVSFLWHGAAVWCAFAIFRGHSPLSRDYFMRLIALFFVIFVIANILAFLLNEPSLEGAESLAFLATFLLFPFSYSISSIANKGEIAQSSAFGCMAAAYGAMIIALVEHFVLGHRAEGAAGNALVFSSVTLMAGTGSLAAALLLNVKWRPLFVGGYAASLLALIYSGSRSLWAVAGLIGLFLVFLYRRQILAAGKAHAGTAIAAAAIALGLAVASADTVSNRADQLLSNWEQVTSEGSYKNSLGSRLALWDTGWDRVLERPLRGYGAHKMRQVIRNSLSEGYGIRATFTHFHNGFLTLLIESGIVGAGAILGVFITIGSIGARTLRTSNDGNERFGAALLLIVLANYGVGGTVNLMIGHDILDTVLMIFLVTGTFLACGTALETTKQETTAEPQPSTPAATS